MRRGLNELVAAGDFDNLNIGDDKRTALSFVLQAIAVLDNCNAPIDTFTPGLAVGSVSSAADRVLFSGAGGAGASSLWNLVDNNGSKHRD